MPIPDFLGLTRLAKPLTYEEGHRILERDHYRCQYCGLDGMSNFENSLIMTVDFFHPRAHKGKKVANNLVTACRPCNTIKGRPGLNGGLGLAFRAMMVFTTMSCPRNHGVLYY